jgi:hypothetical protein
MGSNSRYTALQAQVRRFPVRENPSWRAFDELRPFRLLQHLRQEPRAAHVPTMLVRALPIPIGEAEEARIREAHTTLGVDQFFNLSDEARRTDRAAALQKFRDAVRALLPHGPSKENPDIAQRPAGVK